MQQRQTLNTYTDLAYLYKMADGDGEMIKDILSEFISKIPEYTTSLYNAIGQSNYDQIFFFAHKLKPSFVLVGSSTLVTKLEEIEQLGTMHIGIDKIKALGSEVKAIVPLVIKELESGLPLQP